MSQTSSQSSSSSSSTDIEISQPPGTTSARLIAVRVKSANKNIFRALLSLASANLLMRVVGMLSLIATTYRFGQGAEMDAYNVASLVPTTIAQLIAGGLESSVIPVYARVRARGREEASKLYSTLLNILIICIILFTGLMLLLRDPLMVISAPGLLNSSQHGTLLLADNLTVFIFPVIIFMTLNTFMECLLNTEGTFGWPAYAGIAVPLITATIVFLGGPTYGVLTLCIGTMLGQIVQLIIILIRAHKAHFKYYPFLLNWKSRDVKKVGITAWPALFGSLIQQLGPFVDQIFASQQAAGSITAIAYANKLTSVPTGVIFSSVGRAALPYLANQAAIKDMKAFKGTLRLYVWAVGLSTTLLTVGMIVFSYPIVKILFQRGAFTASDTAFTAVVLIGNVLGLPPMAVGFLVAKAFSALGKTRVLMWTTIFSVIANAIFDYSLGLVWGTFGITLATAVVYYCTMLILIITLRFTIGKLNLLTPPRELFTAMGKLHPRYILELLGIGTGSDLVPLGIPYATWRKIGRGVLVLFLFLGAAVGVAKSPTLALAVCCGSVVILFLLRYQYMLLLCWALISVFVGTSLPLFNGAHLLSGLTIPTLLLLFYLPTKVAFKRMAALPVMLAFFLWMLPTVTYSPLTLSEFFIDWTTLLDFVGVAVLVVLLVNTRKRMHLLIDAMLIPTIFIAFYGIYGFFTKQNGILDSTTNFFRISSVFSDTPPTLAMFLTVIIPLAVYRSLTSKGGWRLLSIATTILLLVTLGLTFTRGALISVPIALIVMILLIPSNRLRFSVLGSSVALIAILAILSSIIDIPFLSDAFSRFGNTDLASLNGRTYLWQAIITHFDPIQLLGYGHGASDQLLTNLKVGFGTGVIATAAHNIFLETMYDHGIIGLLLLIAWLATLGISLLRKMRGATYEHRLIIATAAAAFLGVFIQCFESNDIWNQSVGIYFMMVMALPFTLYWSEQRADLPVIDHASYERETGKIAAIKPDDRQKQLART
jgi:putative peptidoglycan lipid II flippase